MLEAQQFPSLTFNSQCNNKHFPDAAKYRTFNTHNFLTGATLALKEKTPDPFKWGQNVEVAGV